MVGWRKGGLDWEIPAAVRCWRLRFAALEAVEYGLSLRRVCLAEAQLICTRSLASSSPKNVGRLCKNTSWFSRLSFSSTYLIRISSPQHRLQTQLYNADHHNARQHPPAIRQWFTLLHQFRNTQPDPSTAIYLPPQCLNRRQ